MVSQATMTLSGEILKTIVVIIIAFTFKKLVTDQVVDEMAGRARISRHEMTALKKILAIVVYFVAFAYLLTVWNLKEPLFVLLSGAGFAGIIIGFAAKDVFANFLGGFILLVDRPFRIGDIVEIAGVTGTVTDIKLRTTVIYSFDGEYVTIPNANVMTEVVRNRTAPDPNYRVKISIGIDYDSDVNKAVKIILDILKKNKNVLKEPAPQVYFRSFGESSLDLEALYWVDLSVVQLLELKTQLHSDIFTALKKARIKIPYKQIEITMKK